MIIEEEEEEDDNSDEGPSNTGYSMVFEKEKSSDKFSSQGEIGFPATGKSLTQSDDNIISSREAQYRKRREQKEAEGADAGSREEQK